LEQTVAMDSMVGRVLARNQQALTHLTLRLNALINGGISDADNVLAPAQLVQLFVDGYAPLNLDIKVRLIILKMFERHVFNSLDSLYADINELLANAGVLPDLKQGGPVRPPRAERPAPAAGRPAATTGAAEDGAEQQQVLSLCSELSSRWRHVSGDVVLSALGAPSPPPGRGHELLGMLDQCDSPFG